MDKASLGLSGGINSMALLCYLSEQENKPRELHLFYAHFKEHSPDTFRFVSDGIRYARKHFEKVVVKITRNSALDFFETENIIPHPANSPCSLQLKINPMNVYAFENDIKHDLVGYVKHELKRRGNRQKKNVKVDLFSLNKHYPIGAFTDEWCFEIVKRCIGWYPKIYDLKWNHPEFMAFCEANLHRFDDGQKYEITRRIGTNERVFKHNNCLPCKNMHPFEILAIEFFYPTYYKDAMELSGRLMKYWGRDEAMFYATFGRDLGQESTCSTCAF